MHLPVSTSSPDLHLTRLQWFVTVATRLKNTMTCLVIYLVLIALNIIVMIWEWRGGSTRHWVAITLEAIINLILAAEVLTSILHQGKAYFHQYMNVVDLTLTVICLIFFILFLSHPPSTGTSTGDDDEGDTYSTIDLTVLIIRYVFQLTRISVIIYRSHRTTDVLVQDEVDFSVHEMRDKIAHELNEVDSREMTTISTNKTNKTNKNRKKGKVEQQSLLQTSTDADSDVLNTSHSNNDSMDAATFSAVTLAGQIEKELKRSDGSDHDHNEIRINIPVKSSSSVAKRSISPASKSPDPPIKRLHSQQPIIAEQATTLDESNRGSEDEDDL